MVRLFEDGDQVWCIRPRYDLAFLGLYRVVGDEFRDMVFVEVIHGERVTSDFAYEADRFVLMGEEAEAWLKALPSDAVRVRVRAMMLEATLYQGVMRS